MSRPPRQPNHPRHPLSSHSGWSIGSNGLTAAGQSELLGHLGRQLRADYENIIEEPAPDRLRRLMERLGEPPDPDEDKH